MNARAETFDTIVQGATVEMFHSCGIAVAPVKRQALSSELPEYDLGGSIDFNGQGWAGTLILSARLAVFTLVRQDTEHPFSSRDWILELTNQLIGRIRSRLLQFGVSVSVGLPSELNQDMLKKQRARHADAREYTFKTIRGPVAVMITGKIDTNTLKYCSGTNLATEGDVILF